MALACPGGPTRLPLIPANTKSLRLRPASAAHRGERVPPGLDGWLHSGNARSRSGRDLEGLCESGRGVRKRMALGVLNAFLSRLRVVSKHTPETDFLSGLLGAV